MKYKNFKPDLGKSLLPAVCIWGLSDVQTKEYLDKGYMPILGFMMADATEEEHLCAVLFPISFLEKVDNITLAHAIGDVIANELLYCGLKKIDIRNN